MTRLNIVPVEELMDQHLFAEFREIKMVPKSLRRSIVSRGFDGVLAVIPKQFTLNKGHVTFFYDKGAYLQRRFNELIVELKLRGYNIDKNAQLDSDWVYSVCDSRFDKDYIPTAEALKLVRERIEQRIQAKPLWYRRTIYD